MRQVPAPPAPPAPVEVVDAAESESGRVCIRPDFGEPAICGDRTPSGKFARLSSPLARSLATCPSCLWEYIWGDAAAS